MTDRDLYFFFVLFAATTTTIATSSSSPALEMAAGAAGALAPAYPQNDPSSGRSNDLSGLKIRIPRDLPNLPDAFRRRGAVRSQPSASVTSASSASILSPSSSSSLKDTALPYASPGTIKRTYSTMLLEDHQLDLGNHPLRGKQNVHRPASNRSWGKVIHADSGC